ncbi:MAG: hypothetical protein JWR84_1954 [Caulobacter sp.]|nr:hypothetical protein [Caulobacter sp.]
MKRPVLATAAILLELVLLASPALAAPPPDLKVERTGFVYTTPEGVLRSPDLVGAEFDMVMDGQDVTVRIDSVTPSEEQPGVLLHDFQLKHADGTWAPLCDKDAYDRALGFPVAGRWTEDGQYIKDPTGWFLTCTSGSQGKCILWGYDPWGQDAAGRPLDRHYQACQHMVRADYDGKGAPHTRNGTAIDMQDDVGLQKWESAADAEFGFEAGWGVDGATCVARTRWPDLLTAEDLWKASPKLAGPCTPDRARAKGALIFTRVKIR